MEEHLHKPVMVAEVLDWLSVSRGGVFVDCTLGLGGHSRAILERALQSFVIGLDRDGEAVARAASRLSGYSGRFRAVHANYKDVVSVLREMNISQIDGALVDFGVSSLQLESAGRGFSFRQEAPLDMRMDRGQSCTAADLVNSLGEGELADLIFRYGEERGSRRIARAIVRHRQRAPIETTRQLSDIVVGALRRASRPRIDPATRTFQALRIEVNHELEGLEQFLADAVNLLKVDGRLVTITFHSLEDRIVKQSLRFLSGECLCPPATPACVCGTSRKVEILTRKPVTPSAAEIRQNLRARSAKLRACKRVS